MTQKNRTLEGKNRTLGGEGGSKIVENCRTSFMHVPLVEPTDFKNVIVENIRWALSEDAEVAEVKRPRNSNRRKFYYEKC